MKHIASSIGRKETNPDLLLLEILDCHLLITAARSDLGNMSAVEGLLMSKSPLDRHGATGNSPVY